MRCEWNVENITALARRMDQEKERVNSQIQELEKCKSALATALQGDAGIALQEAVSADVQRMRELSSMIDVQAKKLRSVGKQCYERCEESLHGKISELEANMR